MLDGGPGWQAQHPDTVELADGYSQLTVNVGRSIRWSMPSLPGCRSRMGRGCSCESIRRTTNFRSEAASDYIERGRMLVTRLNLDAHNRGDSLVFAASTEDLYLNGYHMSPCRNERRCQRITSWN